LSSILESYEANLTIGKTLTILGPKSARMPDGRGKRAEEAILWRPRGLRLVLSADRIVLTVPPRIPTMTASEPPGVFLDPGFSSCRSMNNVFEHTGLDRIPTGRSPLWFSRNRFEGDGESFGFFAGSARASSCRSAISSTRTACFPPATRSWSSATSFPDPRW